MSRSVISCWQSQMELNTSPTAMGVVVCWRIRRNADWSSAGVGFSRPRPSYFPTVLLRGLAAEAWLG
jgi:hypothetical protein